MTRTILVATTALVALLGSNAAPAQQPHAFAASMAGKPPFANPKARTLYNQNSSGNGGTVLSDCFTSGGYTSSCGTAADDFVIPSRKTWKIGEVDVTGVYFDGSGPATSEIVTFYNDNNGVPGTVVKHGTFTDLSCIDNAGSFSCTLPRKVKLKAGHYWVAVTANINFDSGAGEWGWASSSVIHNDSAVQSCGTGCWTALGEDLLFDLKT